MAMPPGRRGPESAAEAAPATVIEKDTSLLIGVPKGAPLEVSPWVSRARAQHFLSFASLNAFPLLGCRSSNRRWTLEWVGILGRARVRRRCGCGLWSTTGTRLHAPWASVRAVPAFELAILRAIFHSKGPKA
jgi:hypothetical protein